MYDVAMRLPNTPGALAEMGEALGAAGVSLEGGGAWVVGATGTAHFLVGDGDAAARALESSSIDVVAVRPVVVQRLRQDVPGQLGALTRRMAKAGVNIEVLYSDHDGQLILVVDDHPRGLDVAAQWTAENAS
ncbi:MAG: amino acid-binding ACT domain-containing protein [Chloroflexota bacterium]